MNKTALVTGSAGFLGRNMTVTLAMAGYDVTGVDLVDGPGSMIETWLINHPHTYFDLVVHCASYVGGRHDIENHPFFLLHHNLRADAALFEWADIAHPGRVIYISSSAVYPTVLQTQKMGEMRPLLEESSAPDYRPYRGVTPDQTYGFCKLVGERLAAEYQGTGGGSVTVVRPFSGYGPDQSPDYPFRAILDRCLLAEPHDTIEVWSNTVRDFIHVRDVCDGMLELARQDVQGPVNLCTGKATSFVQLVRHFSDVLEKPLNVRVMHNMPTGVAHRVGDPSLMLNYFIPRITLREGVEHACRR